MVIYRLVSNSLLSSLPPVVVSRMLMQIAYLSRTAPASDRHPREEVGHIPGTRDTRDPIATIRDPKCYRFG